MATKTEFEDYCDWGIVCSICAMVFVLPASIAILDSFAALAIFIYLVKKMSRIIVDWPSGASRLNFPQKIHFIWKGFAPPANVLGLPLQFLVLAVFISVVFSHYPGHSFYAFMGKFIKCVFLYFSFIEAFSSEKRIRIFLSVLFLSAFITALSGAAQHYTGKDFLKGHLVGTENGLSTHRVNSTFFAANGFGAYLLPVIGLVIHILYTTLARRKNWILAGVWALFLVLLLACLCWTYSRSAWIGFLFIVFLMIVLDRRKAAFAGLLFLIFYFIFLPSLNQVRNLDLMNDNSSGARIKNESLLKPVLGDVGSGRIDYWKRAVAIIRLSPVWGTGLNTYTKILQKNPDQATWRYAHNCYLQMTAETGLVGLSCFLWVLFVLFRHGFSFCGKIRDDYHLGMLQGAVTGLFAFMVQSFFDNTFYTVQLAVLMWLFFGLIVAVIRLEHA